MVSSKTDMSHLSSRAKETAFDHSLMPPCQAACPLHMEIREYIDLIAQGKVMEALQVIRDGNPFPSICAHVCTHPCEESCRRIQVDKPLAIRALKRFAVEFGGDRMTFELAHRLLQRFQEAGSCFHEQRHQVQKEGKTPFDLQQTSFGLPRQLPS